MKIVTCWIRAIPFEILSGGGGETKNKNVWGGVRDKNKILKDFTSTMSSPKGELKICGEGRQNFPLRPLQDLNSLVPNGGPVSILLNRPCEMSKTIGWTSRSAGTFESPTSIFKGLNVCTNPGYTQT